ncbi:MAG: glutathione S-transferase family protein [Burkholderiaceae bacterium]|nr:glutathione S-transferase family protein [Burkholderiaceae bacterium]
MIEMWELRGEDDRRYSTFSWRTRMALRHKQLEVRYHPVLLTDKAAIGFSGGTTVPVIRDGDTVVRDSWEIAQYLERQYPTRPSLFGGATAQALARLVNDWVDRTVLAAAFPAFSCDLLPVQCAQDRPHFAALIERLTGLAPPELKKHQPRNLERLARVVDPARATLKRQPFLSGDGPAYADYALFSVYQWARIAGAPDVLAGDPPLAQWFGRLLDLNDGFARATPAGR